MEMTFGGNGKDNQETLKIIRQIPGMKGFVPAF